MEIKGEFLWILFLLHMDYAFSEDTCERRTCLGQFSFGHFLPRSIFTSKYEVSPFQCAIECQLRRPRCKSFNYRRSDLTCQLSEEDSGPDGIYLQPKPGRDHSNIDTWRNLPIGHCKEINCSWNERCDPSKSDPQNACVKTECPFAVLKPGVTFQPTHETKIGIKGRYRCVSENLGRGDSLTMCLASTAQWSPTDFKCVCKTTVKSGTMYETAELEVGQIYTYRCQDGLIGKRNQNPTVTCLEDGNWTPTNFACVCKTPPANSGTITEAAEVEIGQNYTYRCQDGLIGKRDLNPTIMCLPGGDWTTTNFTCGAINPTSEVDIGQNYTYKCDINLFKKDEKPTVTCLHDDSWTSTNFICVTQNWTLDTVYPNNIHKSEVISNQTGIHLLTCMQECDKEPTNCLSFFYDNQTGLCVLSSSFQRGLPNGFQFSDGVVYYTAPSTSCDLQYRNVTLAGSYFCIKYHTEPKSFNEAMKACESEKAKLLVVTTENEITDLANIWRNLDRAVFIGLSDQIEEGHWLSWNGEIVHPVWGPGQPDIGNDEDCACILLQSEIHNFSCDIPFPFLCHQKPTTYKTTVCNTPIAKSGTIIEVVEVSIGQNYTYRCQDGLVGKIYQNPTITCQAGGDWTTTNFTCICNTPIAKSGTIIEVVEVSIGQNYTYRCQDGLVGKRYQNPTITCQAGGDWTTTNFTCVCETPQKSGAINPRTEVEIEQNYTYRCEINLFMKGDENPTVTCQHDGSWTSTNFICATQNWTQDTVYPNNIHKSDVISNQTGIHLLTCMQECDKEPTNCLSFFYDNQTGLCVLSSSFQRGLPNGFQFSDGVVYYTAPSTSCDLQYRNITLAGSYFCIKYHTEAKAFNEAMKACESEKAKLLVVTTENEITDLANIWGNLSEVYIGLSDQIEEGHWVSWNGEIVHPSWGPRQPDIVFHEDCAAIWRKNEIHDVGCDGPLPFLCHKIHF